MPGKLLFSLPRLRMRLDQLSLHARQAELPLLLLLARSELHRRHITRGDRRHPGSRWPLLGLLLGLLPLLAVIRALAQLQAFPQFFGQLVSPLSL